MIKKQWWKEEDDNVFNAVTKTVENILLKQANRSEDNMRNVRLYGNVEVLGFRATSSYNYRQMPRLTLNVIKMATDTICARLGKSKPKPTFLTQDGDFSLQRQAQTLEQFVTGQFHMLDLYDIGPDILRDACVFGDGFVYFWLEGDKIKCERVFPQELVIDEDEAAYGKPRQMHRVKFIKKDMLIENFPQFTAYIETAPMRAESYMFDTLENDMVRVIESWRLPGKDKAKQPGKHTITINTVTLMAEEYDHDYFPFVRLPWDKRLLGYFSQGVSEILTGLQIEINKLLKTIQMAMHLGSIPKLLVENGSKVNASHLNNEIGGIIKYSGTKPDTMALMNVPPELFMQLERLYLKAFEQVGLSPLSSTSQKPAGLNSGKALREFHDIETERFSVHAQRYEKFYMDCAKTILRLVRENADSGDFIVTSVENKSVKKIKWKDVKITEDQYVMRLYPSNFLSETPAGRLSDIQDLIAIGLITPQQAKLLLDYPDIESVMSLDNAVIKDIQSVVEGFTDGKFSPPEELQLLDQAIPMIQLAYLKYRNSGMSEEKLDLFRRWLDEANSIIMGQMQPQEEEMLTEEPIMDDMLFEDELTEEEMMIPELSGEDLLI